LIILVICSQQQASEPGRLAQVLGSRTGSKALTKSGIDFGGTAGVSALATNFDFTWSCVSALLAAILFRRLASAGHMCAFLAFGHVVSLALFVSRHFSCRNSG
jgi:hypothetical protein